MKADKQKTISVREEEFNSIIEYAKEQLLKQLMPMTFQNEYGVQAVGKSVILSMPHIIKYMDWLETTDFAKELRRINAESKVLNKKLNEINEKMAEALYFKSQH